VIRLTSARIRSRRLPDTDDGAKTASEIRRSEPPPVRSIWSIGYIKRKLQERRTQKERETSADKAVRTTARATFWMAWFTFALTILSALTLREIHTGSADTHDLAVAAKKQADNTHDLAVAAKKQADNTHDLAVAAGVQADRTKDLADRMKDQANQTKIIAEQAVVQANAAKGANQIASDTLVASDRPWVIAEINLAGPLTFYPNGASITIHWRLTNVGHSPAMNACSRPEPYIPLNPELDPQEERVKLCESTEKVSPRVGQSIFPGHDVADTISMFVSNEQIRHGFRGPQSQVFMPVVIFCIAYQSSLDTKTWFHRGMIYLLTRVDANGQPFAIENGRNVPMDQLRLTIAPWRGVSAN